MSCKSPTAAKEEEIKGNKLFNIILYLILVDS